MPTPSQDPKNSQFAGPCPRCGGGVPNDAQPGQYLGGLSRLDNQTYLCSSCDQDEAIFDFQHPGVPLPPFGQLAR